MAITDIYGFQQFNDYTGVDRIYDLTPFGKLPFHVNITGPVAGAGSTAWTFKEFQDRVWLQGIHGNYNYTGSTAGRQNVSRARSPALNSPVASVFGGYLDDPQCNEFTVGFRAWFPYTGYRRPYYVFGINTVGGNTDSNGQTLLNSSETPDVANVTFYCEFTFDFNLGIVKRWLDSVRLADVALNSTYAERDTFKSRYFVYGYRTNSAGSGGIAGYGSVRSFGLNDFYFVANTEHLDDGLPSGRLGPVEIEALRPKAVALPETWDNATEKEPAALLAETVPTTNMRNVPALTSDASGDKATVAFETPEYKEGEILYCELETYGYRQFGDGVALNTRPVQGGVSGEAKQHEVEPERLRTGARAIRPAKLHRPLDGGVWVEEKLGDLSLELWSTKPE